MPLLKVEHLIFFVKLCRDLPKNKMSINNLYVVQLQDNLSDGG